MIDESIITQWNIDEHGNSISVKTEQQTQVSVGGNLVQLRGVPDEMEGVVIEDEEGNVFYRVENLDEVYDNENAYYLMNDGRVQFHPSQSGKTLHFKYYSKGVTLLSVSRIYYKDSYDNVVKILEDLIKAGFDALKVLEVFGGAKEVIDRLERDLDNGRTLATKLEAIIAEGTPLQQNLHADVTEAKKWKDSLHKDVAEGKILQPQLHQDIIDGRETDANLTQTINSATELDEKIKTTGNASFIIEVENWTTSDDSNWSYMYTLTTSLNSSDLVFKTQEITTKGFEDCLLYNIVKDSNTIAFYTDDKVRTKVVVNARQYGGVIQDFSVVNTDLISEGASNKYVTPQESADIKTIPDIKKQTELNKSQLEEKASKSFLNNEEVYLNRASVNRKLVKKIGNDVFVYSKKPSSEKEYIRFKLGEGASIGTTNQSVGTNYEFLRCYDVVKVSDLFMLKHTPKSFSENVNWITLNINYSNNFDFVVPVEVYKQETKVSGSWIEYEVNTPINTNEIKTMVYKSSGSSSDITISVDGVEVVQNYSLQDSNAGFYNIPIPISISGKHVIRFTTNVAGYMNIAGVCCIGLDDFDNAYDLDYLVEATTTNGEYVKSNGAMDYAILDKDTELWCGSYHGGEARTSLKFIIDGNVLSTLDNNKNYICKSFEIEQETNLVNKLTTYSRQIFYYDGEIELQVIFNGNMNVKTLFTNMSTTKDTFTDIIYPVKATVPTDGKLYLVNGCNYIIQKFNDKNLKAITIINNSKTNDLPPNFKHMTGSYCKLYNANIQNENGELFKGGQFRTIHIYD